MKPNINTTQLRANEAISLRLEISGTGNMKLISNPVVEFPSNFEVYDPTVTNALNVTSNGLVDIRTIEYMAIQRYEGNCTIQRAEYCFFDTSADCYKSLPPEEYILLQGKG